MFESEKAGWTRLKKTWTKWDTILIIFCLVAFGYLMVPKAAAEETSFSVDFSANVTDGYAPMPVQFNNEVIGNQVSGYWMIGQTRYNQTAGPVHIFSEPGVYNVSLTVTDDTNTTLTETKTGFIVVRSSASLMSVSFMDTSLIGDHPVIITDKTNGSVIFAGNTSAKNVLLETGGNYQIDIEQGGWPDFINVPDWGVGRMATYARKNPIGTIFGAAILGIIFARLFG